MWRCHSNAKYLQCASKQWRFLLRLIYILLVDIFLLLISYFLLLMCVRVCQNLSLNLPHPSLCLPQMSPMIFRFALTRTLLTSLILHTRFSSPPRHPRHHAIFLAFHPTSVTCCALVYHILQKRTLFSSLCVMVVVDAIVRIVLLLLFVVLLLFLYIRIHNKRNKNREPRLLHYFSLFHEHLAFIFICSKCDDALSLSISLAIPIEYNFGWCLCVYVCLSECSTLKMMWI